MKQKQKEEAEKEKLVKRAYVILPPHPRPVLTSAGHDPLVPKWPPPYSSSTTPLSYRRTAC